MHKIIDLPMEKVFSRYNELAPQIVSAYKTNASNFPNLFLDLLNSMYFSIKIKLNHNCFDQLFDNLKDNLRRKVCESYNGALSGYAMNVLMLGFDRGLSTEIIVNGKQNFRKSIFDQHSFKVIYNNVIDVERPLTLKLSFETASAAEEKLCHLKEIYPNCLDVSQRKVIASGVRYKHALVVVFNDLEISNAGPQRREMTMQNIIHELKQPIIRLN